MHGHYGPPIGSRPLGVKWSRDRWRQLHGWCYRRVDAVGTAICGV